MSTSRYSKMAKPLTSTLCSIIVLFASIMANAAVGLTPLEQDILTETNVARTQPQVYAAKLEQLRQDFTGKALRIPEKKLTLLTTEGLSALEEAICFLKKQVPLSPLANSPILTLAARDHARDQAFTGVMGHVGSDGSQITDRVNRHGRWQRVVGENISYGPDSAARVIMQLIINDGMPTRSHRENIFNADYHWLGVACGQHPRYSQMCVMTYAYRLEPF